MNKDKTAVCLATVTHCLPRAALTHRQQPAALPLSPHMPAPQAILP